MSTKPNYNRFTFGLGTIGRDMVFTIISTFLIFYLTDILNLPNDVLWWLTSIILFARIFDALNDPIMGLIADNTNTKYGKFKPWIAFGALVSGIFTILIFTDFGLSGGAYIASFAVFYLFWGMSFTSNDIPYWSMLPALSMDQKERERIGAFARICGNLGMFSVVVGIVPITGMLGEQLGSTQKGYFAFAVIIVVIMWLGQSITLFGVKEQKGVFKKEKPTSLKDLLFVIFKNDQLLYTAISMVLFMIGYVTTTGFGLHFFKYAYGDEGMFSVFAAVLGVSQLSALSVFPLFSKRFSRRTLYTASTVLVVLGYIIFFFSPMDMLYIGISGLLIFIGQAFIQMLMLMFLADSVEYGQWKLGKRNESITFALQPFINKMGGAIASGIVAATLIISGITDAYSAADVTPESLLIMKASMLILPLILIVAGYIVYRLKFKIDAEMYKKIVADLVARGDLKL
jgi:melibiose permease/lactose/raffinose/galactose permease